MSFTPTDIAGLRCWEADSLVLSNNDPVSTWTDAGSAGVTFTGSSTARPLYKSAPTGFNGHPALQFDGTNDFLTSSESPAWTDFTIVLVVRGLVDPLPISCRFFDKQYDTGTWIGRCANNSSFNDNRITAGVRQTSASYGQSMAGFDGATTYVVTSRRSGTTHGIHLNGRYNNYVRTVSGTATGAAAYTLGGWSGGDFANIQIAAVFVAPSAVSNDNLDLLYGYLGTKYGITTYPFTPMFRTYYHTSFEMYPDEALGQRMRVLTSDDGLNWVGCPCHYEQRVAVPNPQVMYHAGNAKYYIAHSNAYEGDTWKNRPDCGTISIAESTDGLTYTSTFEIDLSATFYQDYAGCWSVDGTSIAYFFTANLVEGGPLQPFYILFASDMSSHGAPTALTTFTIWASSGFQDPFYIGKISGTHYLVADTGTKLFTSANQLSGYEHDSGDAHWLGIAGIGGDGPNIFQFSPTLTRLYYEATGGTKGVEYVELSGAAWPGSTDWTNAIQQITTGPQRQPASVGTHIKERAGNIILTPTTTTTISPGLFLTVRAGV